jgi:hypothetical protein
VWRTYQESDESKALLPPNLPCEMVKQEAGLPSKGRPGFVLSLLVPDCERSRYVMVVGVREGHDAPPLTPSLGRHPHIRE